MAENPKEIWQQLKKDLKENNTKFAEKQKANSAQSKAQSKKIGSEYKEERARIEKPKADYSKMSGNKFLALLWLLVASFPLFLFGLFLLLVAGVIFWDVIFGL